MDLNHARLPIPPPGQVVARKIGSGSPGVNGPRLVRVGSVAKKNKTSAKSSGELRKSIARNRRARYDYEILDELECGIALLGTEVKGLRERQCSIAEAYCKVKGEEFWLVGMNIPEYSCGNVHNHAPARERRLLAHIQEIRKWNRMVKEKGTTIVPLEIYFTGHLVKVLLGVCRGKRQYDKRQANREASDKRDMDRAKRRSRL